MQLKFKAIRKSDGLESFNRFDLMDSIMKSNHCAGSIDIDGFFSFDTNRTPKDFSVCIFTGLHDSKGQEIYESDVLRLTEISGKQTLYVVISADGCFWAQQKGWTSKQLLFYLIGKTAQTNDGKGNIKKDIWEVVGNRWQPEFKGVFGDAN
jgi:hypothetical protein